MSQLLNEAIAAVRQLPDADQDAIAALILDEIEDDLRWEETFARSPNKLSALAARAADQMKTGQFRRVDPLQCPAVSQQRQTDVRSE